MSVLGNIGAGLSALLPVAGAAGGFALGGPIGAMIGSSAATGGMNYFGQYQNMNYMKGIQHEIFSREDNAVQRRTADLIAAGLSPVLAAGSSASAGNIVKTESPIHQGLDIAGVLSLMKMQQDISLTKAQKDLIESQTNQNNLNTIVNKYNYEFYRDRGQPTNSSGFMKDLSQISGALKSNQVNNALKSITDKLEPSRRDELTDKEGAWQKLDWFFTPQGRKNKIIKGR